MKKTLSLILALVMIISLVPMTASAEEFSGEFKTFEELKTILSAGYTYAEPQYTGDAPLVITEDITIPQSNYVNSFNQPIVIAEGVTVTIQEGGGLHAQALTVNGTIVNNGWIFASASLTVNGSIQNRQTIQVERATVVTGVEKISGGFFHVHSAIAPTLDGLYEALDWAAAGTLPNAHYTVEAMSGYSPDYSDQITLTLPGDLVIPENVNLILSGVNLTVPAGKTLQLEGSLQTNDAVWNDTTATVTVDGTLEIAQPSGRVSLYSDMIVNGKLINNGEFYIGYNYSDTVNIGTLELTEAAAYEGQGRLYISRVEGFQLGDYLIGLDTSIFPSCYEDDWGWNFSYGEMGGGGYESTFTTLDELKALIEAHEPDTWMQHVYTGSEPLVIEGELTIPKGFNLSAYNQPVIVAEGAVLILDDSYPDFRELTVNGTVIVNECTLNVTSTLTINGSVTLDRGYLSLNRYTNVSGLDKVTKVEWGNIQFYHFLPAANMDSLVEALNWAAYASVPGAEYTVCNNGDLSGTITLDRDLAVSFNARLQLEGISLNIPAGKTLRVEGNLTTMSNPWMGNNSSVYVDGTLEIVQGGSLSLYNEMLVNGKLVNNGHISIGWSQSEVYYTGTLDIAAVATYEGLGSLSISRCEGFELGDYVTGMDLGATFPYSSENEWEWYFSHEDYSGGGSYEHEFSSIEELIEQINSLTPGEYLDTYYTSSAPLDINQDLNIPDDVYINSFNAPITIAEGATVTVSEYGGIYAGVLNVHGKLENNGQINADMLAANGAINNNGSIYFGSTSEIGGTFINAGQVSMPIGAQVTGLDRIQNNGGILQYSARCGTNLHELVKYLEIAAADTREQYTYSIDCSDYNSPNASLVLDADLTVPANTQVMWSNTKVTLPAGRTLTIQGNVSKSMFYDGTNFVSAPFLVEGTLNIAPGGVVQIYDDMNVKGKLNNEGILFLGYSWSSTEKVSPTVDLTTGTYTGAGEIRVAKMEGKDELSSYLPGLNLANFDSRFENNRWFLNLKQSAPPSPEIPEGTPEEVLDAITGSGDFTPEQKLDIVQNIGVEELVNALTSAESGTEFGNTLRDLEEELGGMAEVTVSDAPFDANEIMVTGATLNESAGGRIALVVGAPEAPQTLPEEFDTESAVHFSMTLSNAANAAELTVPVEIVLPLPEGFDPAETVILHYHDGEVTTIHPAFDALDNGWLARFVVTGFSDFVIAQPKKAEPEHEAEYGDVNHDGRINVTDAVMVMKHRANALTEDDFFCERCANVDTNPKINVSDAVLIMKKRANKDMVFPIEQQ